MDDMKTKNKAIKLNQWSLK